MAFAVADRSWSGGTPHPAPACQFIDGEHFFVLTANADGTTHLTHGETFSGALVALVKLFDKGSLENNHNGYEDFNQVLKQRVEAVRDTR